MAESTNLNSGEHLALRQKNFSVMSCNALEVRFGEI
jgi:hypothetical protein